VTYSNPAELPAPVGRFSWIATAPADTEAIYVSGVVPIADDGGLAHDGDFAAQAALVYDTLAAALGSAGSSMRSLLHLRTFLTSEDHWVPLRDARDLAFERHGIEVPPPSTGVVVSGLWHGCLIEVEAIAAKAS
jgi:enamine deaminase RidA (YjgF/YER057c/UK114 family)